MTHIRTIRTTRHAVGICLSTLLIGHAASAQDSQPTPTPSVPAATGEAPNTGMDQRGSHPTYDVQFDYSYVTEGDVSYHGNHGQTDAQSFGANVRVQIPVDEHWFVPVNIGSKRLWLGTVAGTPIPDDIETLGLGAGVGYHFDDQWTAFGTMGPAFYRIDDMTSDDVGFHAELFANYRWKPNLTFVFGLGINPDANVPVLPLAGVRWDINDDFTLNLTFPRPALLYHLNPQLDLMVVGGGEFATFRTASDFGNKLGDTRYNHTLGTYRDFHFGVGAEYRFHCGLKASVETGVSFGREIDYKDVDETITFDPGAYVKAGLSWRF